MSRCAALLIDTPSPMLLKAVTQCWGGSVHHPWFFPTMAAIYQLYNVADIEVPGCRIEEGGFEEPYASL